MIQLQNDATQSLDSIAEKVGVSLNTCWRRIRFLEKEGFILGKVARIDGSLVGLAFTVFLSVKAGTISKSWSKKFEEIIHGMPEIVECHRLTGDYDYMLKIIANSFSGYDDVYQYLISKIEFSSVSASISMESVKYTTEIPLQKYLPINFS